MVSSRRPGDAQSPSARPLWHSQLSIPGEGATVTAQPPRRRHAPSESTRHPMPPQSVLGVSQILRPGAATTLVLCTPTGLAYSFVRVAIPCQGSTRSSASTKTHAVLSGQRLSRSGTPTARPPHRLCSLHAGPALPQSAPSVTQTNRPVPVSAPSQGPHHRAGGTRQSESGVSRSSEAYD